MSNGVREGTGCCVLILQSEEYPQSTLSSLLMTIISLSTEHSDPVAPHRVGVSMCVPVPCVCVCVYIIL